MAIRRAIHKQKEFFHIPIAIQGQNEKSQSALVLLQYQKNMIYRDELLSSLMKTRVCSIVAVSNLVVSFFI